MSESAPACNHAEASEGGVCCGCGHVFQLKPDFLGRVFRPYRCRVCGGNLCLVCEINADKRSRAEAIRRVSAEESL